MQEAQPTYKWNTKPWGEIERAVYKLQNRIYKASSRGDVKQVRRLQRLLLKSYSAKVLAVRRVTQDNQGKKTAGVDGVKSLSPKQRADLVNKLNLCGKASATRRVWIPKPGGEERRPLGIPTMYDRALQALVKLALEPEWEAKFEPNSYGFRPGRSCRDAVAAIFDSISQKKGGKYILDADIAKCFDRINHGKLLQKLNTSPTIRRQIRAWLKAGVMDEGVFSETSEGTPQGGVISPLLANIALHGMEYRIKDYLEKEVKMKGKGKSQRRSSVSLIRYADDFVILHEDIAIVQRCKEIISEWLSDIGLELKPSKTRVAHTLYEYQGNEPGLDFLGFNIRQYKAGKYRSGKNGKGQLLGLRTIIKPAKENIKRHYRELAEICDKHKGSKQIALIKELNKKIRGWCNYYSTVVSKKIFSKLSSLMWWKLQKWARRRHQKKGRKWVNKRYWQTIGGDNWVFAAKERGILYRLIKHSEIKVNTEYKKVKGDSSPYDGQLTYWSERMGVHPLMPKQKARLLKKQKGKCPHCGLQLKDGDLLEIDHIIPKALGGNNSDENCQVLHRHCHDEKTALDLKEIVRVKKLELLKPMDRDFFLGKWVWINDIPVAVRTCV